LPLFPPPLATAQHGERPIRRMLAGDTTQRSDLAPDAVFAALREIGLTRLRDTDHLWLILDGSELRTPHAPCMEALKRVRPLARAGLVPGYPTLTVLGLVNVATAPWLLLTDHPLMTAELAETIFRMDAQW
jgi:hypothetical protein